MDSSTYYERASYVNDPNICQPVRLMTDDEVDRMIAAHGRDYVAFHRFIDAAGVPWRPGLHQLWTEAHEAAGR